MEFSACPNPVTPDVEAALLETYGRVIAHMRRNPDTRLFVPIRRAHFAGMRARVLVASERNRLGQLISIGLNNVTTVYEGALDSTLEHSIETFQEREAFHGWLNYKHAALRARLEGASALGPPTVLRDHSEGLIALSACLVGEVQHHLLNRDYENKIGRAHV